MIRRRFKERVRESSSPGKDALLVAPTGSGKTEAAVIPLVSRALDQGMGASVYPIHNASKGIKQRYGSATWAVP